MAHDDSDDMVTVNVAKLVRLAASPCPRIARGVLKKIAVVMTADRA